MRAISNLLAHVILVVSSPIWVTVTKPQLSLTVTPPVKIGGTSLAHSTDTLDGQMMEGGVVSSMVMICTQEPVFPHASVEVQVLSIISGQPSSIVTSLKSTSKPPSPPKSQLSVALAKPVLSGSVLSLQSIVISPGQSTVGGVESSTKMVCTHVLEFPHSS